MKALLNNFFATTIPYFKGVMAFLCMLLLSNASVKAQKMELLSPVLIALEPINVFPMNAGEGYVFTDKNKDTKRSVFTVEKTSNGFPLITAEVFSALPNHFGINAAWKNTSPIKKGDILVARLSIRSIYAKQESGDAVVNFFVQQATPPGERVLLMELSVGPEWKTVDIPFTSIYDMEVGEASMGFTYGALAQKVEITNMQVLNFGRKATVSQMPATRLTYKGREAGAAWRKEALIRIDKLRTAPLIIRVTDAKGKAVKGATVKATLIDPEFIFGTALSAHVVMEESTNGAMYRRLVPELFNAVTIDNNLKWPDWRNLKKREVTKTAMDWIAKNNLRLRGHNLVWPGRKFTPNEFKTQPDFGPSFSDSITAHIEDIATYTKGKVYGWDVINEMLHEKDYFNVMPRTQAVEWFKQAKRIDPAAQLFINEYSMLNNIRSPQNIQGYLDVIKELRTAGAPIDAIGVQGHVGRQPRNPAQVLTDLDMFIATGLPVQITEFDINSPDEQLQADYTMDFLIACYSHPAVTGFTMWGFWEAAHWKPDAAMYKKDWTPKPNAAVWREWVTKKWKTNVTALSNKKGLVNTRGHFGKYEVTVTKNGVVTKGMYQLHKNNTLFTVML